MPSEQPIGKIKSAKSRLPQTRRVLTVLREIETLLRQSDAILNGASPIMPEEPIVIEPPAFDSSPTENSNIEVIEEPSKELVFEPSKDASPSEVSVDEDEEEVRHHAKSLGIKRWNVKGLDKLRDEIRQHENAEHGEHEHGH